MCHRAVKSKFATLHPFCLFVFQNNNIKSNISVCHSQPRGLLRLSHITQRESHHMVNSQHAHSIDFIVQLLYFYFFIRSPLPSVAKRDSFRQSLLCTRGRLEIRPGNSSPRFTPFVLASSQHAARSRHGALDGWLSGWSGP